MVQVKDIFKAFWGYQRAAFFVVRGIYALLRFKAPIISFFGGKNMPHESEMAHKAALLAHRFAQSGCAILSGGGPGLMKAANCGAQRAVTEMHDGKPRTLGIGVEDLDTGYTNGCGSPFIRAPYFFVRKWLLINYTQAFVIFPGGIGTMDELFEVLNLMKVGSLPIRPVILVGTEFWQPLMAWITKSTQLGYVPERCEDMLFLTDDMEEVYSVVMDAIHAKLGTHYVLNKQKSPLQK